jgi:hypothetical protein
MSRELTIRYDEADHCLRSTSAELPGIVVFAFPNRQPSFAIDYAFEPTATPPGVTPVSMEEEGIGSTATAVSIEEVVEGCAGHDELRHLYGIACQAMRDGSGVLLASQEFAVLRDLVNFVEEVAQAIEEKLDP